MTFRRRAASGGFTLIELLVAAALLAVLAVLAWRGLDAVLATRNRLTQASNELRSLTLAFAQLDEDLRRSWPVRLLQLPVPAIGFSVAGERATATLEVVRETTGALSPTQIQRVAWRLRDGVLERGFGRWLSPSGEAVTGERPQAAGAPRTGAPGGGGESAADSLVWQPVLTGVSALQMQGWIDGQGWVAAEALAGQLTGTAPASAAAAGAGLAAPGVARAMASMTARPAVTGLLVRVVRDDGSVLQRILPVRD
jgi:general secretion pathway protein J